MSEASITGDTEKGTADKSKGKKSYVKLAVFGTLFVALLVLGVTGNVKHYLQSLETWIQGFGSLAPIIFIFVYIVATVAALPGSIITGFAGALFGPWLGTVLVSIGSTAGATLAFLVSRYLLRDSIMNTIGENPKFQKLDSLTEKVGSAVVAITRLVPLFPFNILNYGFGLTKVPLGTYVFWSWLCMLPGTVLYVVAGAAITDILKGNISPTLWIVLIVDIALLSVAGAFARKKLLAANVKGTDQTGEAK